MKTSGYVDRWLTLFFFRHQMNQNDETMIVIYPLT
jgi:hypothetical protein